MFAMDGDDRTVAFADAVAAAVIVVVVVVC